MNRDGCSASKHGTSSAYDWWRCRCPDAREAWRLYRKRLRHGRQPAAHVPAVGTVRRLRALVAGGYTWTMLGARLGVTVQRVRQLALSDAMSVHRDTARKVGDLYEALSAVPGGSGYALKVAARYRWVPPFAWDDDALDDPAGVPAVAPDGPVVDVVAVERALEGERLRLTAEERHLAVHRAVQRNLPDHVTAEALRMSWSQVRLLRSRPLPEGSVAA